jgi:B9 domain-containing protein 2
MAEVHIIGQIVSGTGFPEPRLFCKWGIHAGAGWKLLTGIREGQSQVDMPAFGDTAYFCHPIDVHFSTKGLQGWPKIFMQIWHHDYFGRDELYGYGFCQIPTAPGMHEVECVTWRPVGSFWEEVSQLFVGGGPQLTDTNLIFTGAERSNLRTKGMGTVKVQLNVVLRNFEKFGVDC